MSNRAPSTSGVPAASKSALWTLPNYLSVLRIFLVPLLMVFLLIKYETVGLVIFLAASLTDWLDGYLARRRKQVTTLGQLLDPLADKLLITAAFISLVELDLVAAWMVVIIVGRELAVTGLRSIAAGQGVTIAASPLGKYKMVAQVVAVSLLIAGPRFLGDLFVLGQVSLWVVLALSIVSGGHYFIRFWDRVVLGATTAP